MVENCGKKGEQQHQHGMMITILGNAPCCSLFPPVGHDGRTCSFRSDYCCVLPRSSSSNRRHRLSHAARGRRQIGGEAGAPSGVDAICKHAAAGFHALKQETARQASHVTFRGKTVQDVITAAFEGRRVS